MDLGMYNAFNPNEADFTSLREEGNIYIDRVLHKTYLIYINHYYLVYQFIGHRIYLFQF